MWVRIGLLSSPSFSATSGESMIAEVVEDGLVVPADVVTGGVVRINLFVFFLFCLRLGTIFILA